MTATVIKQMAYLTGVILHAGTGRPVDGQIRITADEGPVVGKVLADGTFVVSGYEKFTTGLNLHFHVEGPEYRAGFVDYTQLVTFPAGADFDPEPPAVPTALVEVGAVLLPADKINVRGRVVEAKNPDMPVTGATVTIKHDGPNITATTDSEGRYRFEDKDVKAHVQIINGKVVATPAEISCSIVGFVTETRAMLLNYSKLINEENFRLAPV